MVLVLLDLIAAFDTVDHEILVSRLERCVGITGIALKWFHSYLKDRTFSVNCVGSVSTTAHLSCGIPQGSILGPLLFPFISSHLAQYLGNMTSLSIVMQMTARSMYLF